MGVSYVGLLLVAMISVVLVAKGDDVPPGLTPFFDELCKEVECGKGRCEAAPGYPFSFKCDCDDGWKRTRLDDEDNLEFLPCIIPDCEVDYSCMAAPPPLPSNPYNISAFDPCYWVYCGEGTCQKNLTRTHTCQCNPGYSNLLNVSAFPCYSDCAIGSNSCQRLGIKSSSSTSNPSADNNTNQAATPFSMGSWSFYWIPILLATTALPFWI